MTATPIARVLPLETQWFHIMLCLPDGGGNAVDHPHFIIAVLALEPMSPSDDIGK